MVDAARPAQDVFKKQAEEWFVRGHHDIETAQLLYEQNGYVDLTPETTHFLTP